MLVNVTLPPHRIVWEFIAVLVTGVLLIMAVITRDSNWLTSVGAALVAAAAVRAFGPARASRRHPDQRDTATES